MAAFLVIILVFAPLLAPCVVAATALALVLRSRPRAGGSWWPLDTGSYVLVTVMSGAAALGAYAYGVMSGFYILDPDQMCAAVGTRGDHVVTRMTLPVSAQCVTSGGVGTELVPGWVNPVVYASLVLTALALGAAIGTGVRRRTANRS
ncbi:hypothetical protein ABZ896_31275 [Streptomyces sp. NPDC047072]|uniref:hypothetical protein n=1 Tax=Streptomyces sp. NPDC047072 TaxID=3154809 RepID=UPI0033CEC600